MAFADVAEILKGILVADPLVSPLVTHTVGAAERVAVYAETLPPKPLMDPDFIGKPSTAIVVTTFPGTKDADIPFRRSRVIVRSYGPTQQHAKYLDLVVQYVFDDKTYDVGDFRLVTLFQSGPNVDVDSAGFPFADSIYEVPNL